MRYVDYDNNRPHRGKAHRFVRVLPVGFMLEQPAPARQILQFVQEKNSSACRGCQFAGPLPLAFPPAGE